MALGGGGAASGGAPGASTRTPPPPRSASAPLLPAPPTTPPWHPPPGPSPGLCGVQPPPTPCVRGCPGEACALGDVPFLDRRGGGVRQRNEHPRRRRHRDMPVLRLGET